MKVVILNIKPRPGRKCINKDLAGGLGTGTWVGDSFLARVFEKVKKANVVLPELTNAYLLAIFKKAGWQTELVEIETVLPDLGKADLVLVGVSIVDCVHELEVVRALKERGHYVGVFGAFATAMPDFWKEADFVIKGEPEAAALKILSQKELPRGIVEVEPLEDLDSLPYPDWSFFPIKKYSYSPALNKKPVLLMLASRGCPYSCIFYCPYAAINSGRRYRARSIGNVIAEIEHLVKKYQVKAIDFRDPIFSFDRSRTLEFCRQLAAKKFDLIWSCETRMDRLDEELLMKMKKAGLRHINVGIESFDEEVLKSSGRLPVAIEHQEKMLSFCARQGISVAAFYILGMENDTRETIERTIDYAKDLNTLVAQFTLSTPYPGTEFFEKMKEESKVETFDWEKYDAYTPVFKHKNLSNGQLLELKEKAFVSYYFRPAYLLAHMPKYFCQKLWPF